ncbi:MAG: dTMP kinase [Clostridiales bacterium]|jgi:dTMP kinase|nr:dTMP kinase [Clostridiales bacterium]
MKSFFITMEGGDGSGKSLQAKALYEALREKGAPVILAREPGGTGISEKIREIIIDKENKTMSAVTETFLYAAARAQIVAELIRPALLDGKIVICDRFLDSSIAYQGAARGLGAETVDIINSYATGGLMPDITFFFDVDPAVALRRKSGGALDRLESEHMDFHKKVYKGYCELAQKNAERIIAVDGTLAPEEISRIVLEKVTGCLS